MTAGNSATLLIAEDDPDDQLLIQDALGACRSDVNMRFVWDGMELMRYLRQTDGASHKPSLILLDLNMPKKDGRTALREIMADPALAEIPVVVLTTSNAPEDVHYCQSLGVREYHRKPSSIRELEDILTHLCDAYLS